MMKRPAGAGQMTLPEVAAPSLQGLWAVVPKPPPPETPDIAAALRAEVLAISPSEPRASGEAVQPSDALEVSISAWHQGRLIPFSCRFRVGLFAESFGALPGLVEGLVGRAVGSDVEVPLTLPLDYPVATLAGQSVVFRVRIHSARVFQVPEHLAGPLLEKLNLGASVPEVLQELARRLYAQRLEEAKVAGENRILDQLASRAIVEVPEALIDEEISQMWTRNQLPILSSLGIGPADQQAEREQWVSDANTRADARRRLKISLVLGAVARDAGLKHSEAAVGEMVHSMAKQTGQPIDQVLASLSQKPEAQKGILATALHLTAVNYVLEHAQLAFDPPL